MSLPKTKKENIVEKFGNISISDPYRWLEDRKNSDVKDWVETQNQYTSQFLKNGKCATFSDELASSFNEIAFSVPVWLKGQIFYSERHPGEDQWSVYYKKNQNGEPIKLVDPNQIDQTGNTTISFWSPSRSGKHLVYGLSVGGTENATLFIKDIEENKNIVEIASCQHSSVHWLPEDRGFFYTSNKNSEDPKNGLHKKVYFHKMGDDPSQDEMIFGKDRPKGDMIGLTVSPDGRYIAIDISNNWSQNEIYIYDLSNKKTTVLIDKIPALFGLSFTNDKVLVSTNYKANNFRILYSSYADMFKPIDSWSEFVSEKENTLIDFWISKDKIIVEYLVNVCSKVILLNHNGEMVGDIPLPEFSCLSGITCRRDESVFFYSFETFTSPTIIYKFSPENNEFEFYRKKDADIKHEDYLVTQEWSDSKDGTKIPMFIVRKKNVKPDSLNPTLLYGYGGFQSVETPGFLKSWTPWLERGGIFVIANIRGGGEFGKKWHDDGIKDKKQNSYDDFILAAEYLIKKGYTGSKKLGILGGSNGGLLVSTVAVQRPELFKAVRSAVPLTDMVRFPKFGMAVRWIHEYGNPEKPDDLKSILKWSPYHNVKAGVMYPSFLVVTGENDVRVDPLHARKMTALLQELSDNKKVYLFTEKDSGHGLGKSIKKVIESQALALTFFAGELGLNDKK